MIFNCTTCCKAISSQNETCPYCMVQLSQTGLEEEVVRKERRALLKLAAKRKIAKVSRTSAKVPETIGHIVNSVRTAKPHHT